MSEAASPSIAPASSAAASGNLTLYELQKPFVEPMLRLCRLTNTALDVLFYDVSALTKALLAQHLAIDTGASRNAVFRRSSAAHARSLRRDQSERLHHRRRCAACSLRAAAIS